MVYIPVRLACGRVSIPLLLLLTTFLIDNICFYSGTSNLITKARLSLTHSLTDSLTPLSHASGRVVKAMA